MFQIPPIWNQWSMLRIQYDRILDYSCNFCKRYFAKCLCYATDLIFVTLTFLEFDFDFSRGQISHVQYLCTKDWTALLGYSLHVFLDSCFKISWPVAVLKLVCTNFRNFATPYAWHKDPLSWEITEINLNLVQFFLKPYKWS